MQCGAAFTALSPGGREESPRPWDKAGPPAWRSSRHRRPCLGRGGPGVQPALAAPRATCPKPPGQPLAPGTSSLSDPPESEEITSNTRLALKETKHHVKRNEATHQTTNLTVLSTFLCSNGNCGLSGKCLGCLAGSSQTPLRTASSTSESHKLFSV